MANARGIRPDQAAFNQLDFYTYGAGVGLFSAGGCFHSQTGKLANLPTKDELDCYNAFMQGMELFPPDSVLGSYHRPVENSLRTYIVGDHMIRVRPTSINSPVGPEYKPLDTFNICYSKANIEFPADKSSNNGQTNDDMPKHTYDEMMSLASDMNKVIATTTLAKGNPVVDSLDLYPTMTTAHLLWRWFFEGYTNAQILEETRKRGNGEPV